MSSSDYKNTKIKFSDIFSVLSPGKKQLNKHKAKENFGKSKKDEASKSDSNYRMQYKQFQNEVEQRFTKARQQLDRVVDEYVISLTPFGEYSQTLPALLKHNFSKPDAKKIISPAADNLSKKSGLINAAALLYIYLRKEGEKETTFYYYEIYTSSEIISIITINQCLKEAFYSLGYQQSDVSAFLEQIRVNSKYISPKRYEKIYSRDWRMKPSSTKQLSMEDVNCLDYIDKLPYFSMLGLATIAHNLDGEYRKEFGCLPNRKLMILNFITDDTSLDVLRKLVGACFVRTSRKDYRHFEEIKIDNDTVLDNTSTIFRIVLLNGMDCNFDKIKTFDKYKRYIDICERQVDYPYQVLFVLASRQELDPDYFINFTFKNVDSALWQKPIVLANILYRRILTPSIGRWFLSDDITKQGYRKYVSGYATSDQEMIAMLASASEILVNVARVDNQDEATKDALHQIEKMIYNTFSSYMIDNGADTTITATDTYRGVSTTGTDMTIGNDIADPSAMLLAEDSNISPFEQIIDFLNQRIACGLITKERPIKSELNKETTMFIYPTQQKETHLCFFAEGIDQIIKELNITGYTNMDFISCCKTKLIFEDRDTVNIQGKTTRTLRLRCVQQDDTWRIENT